MRAKLQKRHVNIFRQSSMICDVMMLLSNLTLLFMLCHITHDCCQAALDAVFRNWTRTEWHHDLRDSFQSRGLSSSRSHYWGLPWPPGGWRPCSKTRSWCRCCSSGCRRSPSSSCLPGPWSRSQWPEWAAPGPAAATGDLKHYQPVYWVFNGKVP